MIGVIFVILFFFTAGIFIYTYSLEKKVAASIDELRKIAFASGEKIIGSYNAYLYHGGTFKTYKAPTPAVLVFNDDAIVLTLEDLKLKSYQLKFTKDDSQVIWIGNSGRSKDYSSWLMIKDAQNTCLFTILSGQPCLESLDVESKECATEFLSKITELGFNTKIEAEKRHLFTNIFAVIVTLIVSVFTALNGYWIYSIIFFALFIQSIIALKSK